jgi:hypothetical protein
VGDTKEPAMQVFIRSILLQMMEQSEKRFLHYVFAILHGYAKAHGIPQQPLTHQVEKLEHYFFD